MRRLMIVVAALAAWSMVTAFPSIGAQDAGTLANTVSVPGAPVPCMTLGAPTIDWGTLDFAGLSQTGESGSDTVAITDCSGVSQSLTVAGTLATSSTSIATWRLEDPLAVSSMCGYAADTYGVAATNGVSVGLMDAVFQPLGNIGNGLTSTVGVSLWMPCVGSAGEGETFTFDINFLVTIP